MSRTRNRMNEDAVMRQRYSQLLGPKTGEMGKSDGLGLKYLVWKSFWLSDSGGWFSLVTYTCISSWIFERSLIVLPEGSKRSSMARSTACLKAQMSLTFGTGSLWIFD